MRNLINKIAGIQTEEPCSMCRTKSYQCVLWCSATNSYNRIRTYYYDCNTGESCGFVDSSACGC